MRKEISYILYPEKRQIEKILIFIWSIGIPVLLFGYFADFFSLFIFGIALILLSVMYTLKMYPESTFDLWILFVISLGIIFFILSLLSFLNQKIYQGIEASKLFAFIFFGIGIIMFNERQKGHPIKGTLITISSIIIIINIIISLNKNAGHIIRDYLGEFAHFVVMIGLLFLLVAVKIVWKRGESIV